LSWWHFATQDNYRLGTIDTVAADCYVLVAIAVIVALALVPSKAPFSEVRRPPRHSR
jgi:hypothetical protein